MQNGHLVELSSPVPLNTYTADTAIDRPANDEGICVRMPDDSMQDAGIFARDLLHTRPNSTPNDGDIVLVFLRGGMMVRRFFDLGSRICLMADSSYYPAIEIHQDDDFEIGGVVNKITQYR